MKRVVTVLVILVVVLIIFVVLGPFYILEEGQQAVVIRFGRIVDSQTEAGLKFKMPMVDNVLRYSKKVLAWDGDAQRIPTQENQFIWVDTTARWRISDPVQFYEAITTIEQAYGRLDEVMDSSVRTIIARNELREAVRNSNIINEIDRTQPFDESAVEDIGEAASEGQGIESLRELTQIDVTYETVQFGRQNLSEQMEGIAREIVPQFGIELIDIIIRQIRYSDDLTASVYARMIAERKQIAQAFRSYGEGKKQEWLGRLENEKKSILSRAYERAETIRGEADAEATVIYADTYQQDPDFFQFWRAVESYRRVLPKFRKTLTTDMDYFRYLYSADGE